MQRLGFSIPLFCLAFLVCETMTHAQPPARPGGGRGGAGQSGGRRGAGGPSGGRAGSGGQQAPWVAIFDTDGDGVITESEIKNAVASLRKLDRDGNGKIAGEELRPTGATGPTGGTGGRGNASAPVGGRGAGGPGGGRSQAGGGGRGPGTGGGRGPGAGGGRGPGAGGGRGPGAGGGRGPGGGGGRGGDPAQADAAFASQVMSLDANHDGLISLAELPDHMHKAFETADADKSGSLNQKELLMLASQFRRNKLNPEGDQQMKNAPTQGRRPTGNN